MAEPDRITRILALAESATKGPWKHENDGGRARLFHWVKDDEYNDSGQEWEVLTHPARNAPLTALDAAFIAASRTETPWLAETLKEALRLLDDALPMVDRYTIAGDIHAFLARVRREGEL